MNKNFAIKLVAEEPVTDVHARVVSCDGGGGALGHPKVYINLVGPYIYYYSLVYINLYPYRYYCSQVLPIVINSLYLVYYLLAEVTFYILSHIS